MYAKWRTCADMSPCMLGGACAQINITMHAGRRICTDISRCMPGGAYVQIYQPVCRAAYMYRYIALYAGWLLRQKLRAGGEFRANRVHPPELRTPTGEAGPGCLDRSFDQERQFRANRVHPPHWGGRCLAKSFGRERQFRTSWAPP